jgi:hypothetical protein
MGLRDPSAGKDELGCGEAGPTGWAGSLVVPAFWRPSACWDHPVFFLITDTNPADGRISGRRRSASASMRLHVRHAGGDTASSLGWPPSWRWVGRTADLTRTAIPAGRAGAADEPLTTRRRCGRDGGAIAAPKTGPNQGRSSARTGMQNIYSVSPAWRCSRHSSVRDDFRAMNPRPVRRRARGCRAEVPR